MPPRARQVLERVLLYVGTYTESLPYVAGEGPGIVCAEFDLERACFTILHEVGDVRNPSYLALGRSGRRLYAANETEDFAGAAGGGVTAFSLDHGSGRPVPLNECPTGGRTPCHLAVLGAGHHLGVANYGGGSISVIRLRSDGSLERGPEVVEHRVPSADRAPHPHMVLPDPTAGTVHVPDLGADTLVSYRLDGGTGRLSREASTPLAPGSGPRHMALHPSGKFAFLANELDSTVICLRMPPAAGAATETLSTVPAGFTGANAPASVVVSPAGDRVYVSNRGHDSVAAFAFDENAGRLRLVAHVGTGGEAPQDLALSRDGGVLFVANLKSNNVAALRLDAGHGSLTRVAVMDVPTPGCVLAVDPSGSDRRASDRPTP